MKRDDLKRYLELREKISLLEKELKLIADNIKIEFKNEPGQRLVDGISYGLTLVVQTKTDLDSLALDIGPEKLAEYQMAVNSTRLFVKPTSEAL